MTHTEHFSSININVGSRKLKITKCTFVYDTTSFWSEKESVTVHDVSYFCAVGEAAVAVNIYLSVLSFSY